MGKVILDISMSLDGFIAGPKNDAGPDRELQALEVLHDWMFRGKTGPEVQAWQAEKFKNTGAFIMGRRMFDLGVGFWGDNPPFHAPCFVLSHRAQAPVVKQGGTTYDFVTDGPASALAQAQAAAGNRDIMVMGGANAAQQYLQARLLDEIHLHLVPVLLGQGIRLFENLGTEPIQLDRQRVTESPGVTHLFFRVVR